jgi:mRNA-degrading endonuclease toxin of MazEF toxin-antitoxin module
VYERGDVCWARLPGVGRTPVLIVSARVVTLALRPIVARITSVERDRPVPTAVRLEDGEVSALPERSWVICHDLFTLLDSERLERIGTVSPRRMVDVEEALRAALAL